MKLWKKISLICSCILVTVVAACTAIVLGQVQEKMLSISYKQIEGRLEQVADSFQDMVRSHYSEEDSYMVKRSLISYCFCHYADSSCVLLWGEDRIYSQVSLRPEEYLELDNIDVPNPRFTGKIGGRYIFIVGSQVYLPGFTESCYVYMMEDVTPVYEDIARMFWQFALIGGAGIGVGLILIIFLIRRHLKPLAKLQTTASRIASGSYWERAEVYSKDEIGMLAADFNSMAEAVERHINDLTEKARRQQLFIGGVTHEFKTPLTAILLNVDSLQNTYLDEEERMEALAQMERQCRWLERLVQKLLKLITLNQEIEPGWVPAYELLDKVQESVAENLCLRGVGLKVKCEVERLYVDSDLMQSALINLVDNGAKASGKGQTVELKAYGNVLEVRDEGIGMEREEIARITEAFYRVDKSRSKKNGGVGLGLALVKEIVEAHGGRMEIESQVGRGTAVRICLER